MIHIIASPTAKVYLEGYSVKPLDQHDDLGVLTDLPWTAHYEKILCCISYRSPYLIHRSLSSALPVNLKRDLYLALVRSQLIY